ncbi:MAG TPA: peptidylprolyl isomerase [Chitinophagaceae bacterium]|nr:peptidylprolyl isomerase [Chitinophagaceae bacterium]HNJ55319.1 peptidylprolyl isomerase [Chitinophagaceae bacterium]HNK60244.1 peptidylprolyl isomerase [Chitinophagaceae bacterium]
MLKSEGSTFEIMLSIKKLLTICFVLVSGAAMAQPQSNSAKVVADKIIAIVGDRIILNSDIKNSIEDARRRGEKVPDDGECQIMDQALISKILMLQAEKDSLPVTDDEVEADLDNRIRQYINQVGSQDALEEMAGKTIYQIKDDARESIREQKLAAAMQRKVVDGVRITPNEVTAWFNKIPKDSLPFFESELEVCQIILYPKASRDVELYILGEMQNLKKQLENKQVDWCAAAKKSDDPGSRDRCGQYQINRNEKTWDPVFLATAFRLKEGEISAPVKSKFGYHIIKMVQRNGDDAVVQHILRIPPVTEDEISAAEKKLDSIRTEIANGNIHFNAAATKYSDDETTKFAGPCIMNRDGSTHVTIDLLDKDMVGLLSKMNVGDISKATPFTDEQEKKGVRIVYLKSRTEPHRMNLHDDYSRISNFALDQKKNKVLEKWLMDKIPTYYLMIDPQAQEECPSVKKFIDPTRKSF